MVISKRAQLFLLTAVIISSIVISLGITANQARISPEPKNFHDFSYEVKREIGAVIDYEIYTNFSEEDNLEEFVDILAENIQDDNPDANFIFVYGDNTDVTLKTYDSQISDVTSTISIGQFYKTVGTPGTGITESLDVEDLEEAEEIIIEIGDYEFSFPISKYPQVIFLMKKDVGDESFITIG